MEKQVQIYSVDTSDFYNEQEMIIHKKLNKSYRLKNKLKKRKKKIKKDHTYNENRTNRHLSKVNRIIKSLKGNLYEEFSRNTGFRSLNDSAIHNKNVISVFDSVLTRTLGITENTLSTDIMVVQTYFFNVLKDIILNGFMYNGEKYVCFTASAGQIRTKKTLFIKEKVLQQYQNSLMCGLTVESINEHGGVNINKYLAYLALCNSATDEWTDFNIDKAIVVDDMETCVRSVVDFIDEKTYEITRQEMDVLINHTDGCGMILPRKSKKSLMVRMPWIKGLLVPFPFNKFIREHKGKASSKKIGIVKDIYGVEHDLLKNDIEVILTKSQFKMWKYYSSWQDYKDKYRQYNCQAGKCNEEEDNFSDAKLNYQMLQTLTDMTDEELKTISLQTKNNILNIGRDKQTMLRVLGVTRANNKKNYYQQALEIYPELLRDTYSKEILKQVKKKTVKEARLGKLDVRGKYTFICPDLYAFCEYLILGDQNPNGFLKNGEVYCSIYNNDDKLDCLRSPHLYREHAIRTNVLGNEKSRWFITNGLYTSCHDPISKLLMFDVDGDKALVTADKTIVEVAERNMKDIVPLYYNMAKADSTNVDNAAIYDGLRAAYTGGNIGMISNDITKIWNSGNVNMDVIKWLCMENNFTIDYAKTLYKVKRPQQYKKTITGYTKSKTPHFFIYAKDKKKGQVEKVNSTVVNKLEKMIPNTPINFKTAHLGKLDHKMLMSNKDVELDQTVIDKYVEMDLNRHFMINIDGDSSNITQLIREIRNSITAINNDVSIVTDMLIEYLYVHRKSNLKTTLWDCFGDIIVENLIENIDNDITQCASCGTVIEVTSNRKKYCEECWKEKQKILWRESKRKNRKINNNVQV